MTQLKEILKKLYQRMLFYKEYAAIFILGLSAIFWLMWVFSNPVNKVLVQKEDQNLKLDKPQEQLTLPKNSSLIIHSSQNGIDKKKFIESYKNNLKSLNTIKGKIALRFSFYQVDQKTTSVEVLIKWEKKNSKEMIHQKHIIRMVENKE